MTVGETHWLFYLVYLIGVGISIGLSIRIIMLQRPAGATFAWILIVVTLPYAGAFIYLLIGENRLGEKRARRARKVHRIFYRWLSHLQQRSAALEVQIGAQFQPICRQAQRVVAVPPFPGNQVQLLDHYEEIFQHLIADIDRAQKSCHLEFYIWEEGGVANEVVAALLRACERGVVCRVLLDAVGSLQFLRSGEARRLREAGVLLVEVLPVSPYRILFRRADLRNHRKIVVIDGMVAYTGSQNLADPRYFKQGDGVGEWIDVMVRVTGPVVEALAGVFVEDWQLETGQFIEHTYQPLPVERSEGITVQAIPSGPVFRYMAIHQLLTTTLYSARRELTIVTPYFVPDDTLKLALVSAAQRGVDVTLIVPEQIDSRLVRYASRSLFGELLQAGVRIAEFRGGLLHTKLITVDGAFCILGSVNMDMRSLWLNFEISLFIYDEGFTRRIDELAAGYLRQCRMLERRQWKRRPMLRQFVENVARLIGPLL